MRLQIFFSFSWLQDTLHDLRHHFAKQNPKFIEGKFYRVCDLCGRRSQGV